MWFRVSLGVIHTLAVANNISAISQGTPHALPDFSTFLRERSEHFDPFCLNLTQLPGFSKEQGGLQKDFKVDSVLSGLPQLGA